jgi:hypothetical protein
MNINLQIVFVEFSHIESLRTVNFFAVARKFENIKMGEI